MEFKGLRTGAARLAGAGLALLMVLSGPAAMADNDVSPMRYLLSGKGKIDDDASPFNNASAAHSKGQGGPSTTETRISNGQDAPFLTVDSPSLMQAAENRYAAIVAQGGWGSVPGGKYAKGTQSKGVAALNKRLNIEGYLRIEGTEGDVADVYTSATEDAVSRFQRNHGLSVTGSLDGPTIKELNIPAEKRLAAIRANLPRVAEYSKDLGERYVVVNVPAAQLETIAGGQVYSIHNTIVGRPSRPTPVVETQLATVRFNPYWNAPPSIIERDIVPRMLSNRPSAVLNQMNIKVFDGVGGPEINPDRINWRRAVVDNYHFRQEPGGGNAMATAKIEFNSPFGIYLHDTPEPELFNTAYRFYSSGCVRVQKVAILINWVLSGQNGIDPARISDLAKSKERLDVTIANAPHLRVVYLTAWAAKNGEVAFRPDIYEMDGSGFVLGQPLAVGEKEAGLRYILKPVVRSASAVDDAEGFSLFNMFGGGNNLNNKNGNGNFGPILTPKASASKPGARRSIFSSATTNKPKKVVKKTAKPATTVAKAVVKKKPAAAAATADAGTTTKKAGTATAAPTAKTPAADTCKPDKAGKLPAGCKVSAVKKPVPKPAAVTAAN